MKIKFKIDFEFKEPEEIKNYPNRLMNIERTNHLFLQAYDAFRKSFDEWAKENHPAYEICFMNEYGNSHFQNYVTQVVQAPEIHRVIPFDARKYDQFQDGIVEVYEKMNIQREVVAEFFSLLQEEGKDGS